MTKSRSYGVDALGRPSRERLDPATTTSFLVVADGMSIEVAVGRNADIDQIKRTLEVALGLRRRLDSTAERLQTSVEDVIEYLERLGWATPAGAGAPGSGLTLAEEDVLREAGSLESDLPPVAERASTVTANRLRRMLDEAVTAKEAAVLLGVTAGRVRQMIAARTLVAVQARGGWKLPRFQFPEDTPGGVLRGLDRVLLAMPADVHPLVVESFLAQLTPDLILDGMAQSPRDWLLCGGSIDVVVELAAHVHQLP